MKTNYINQLRYLVLIITVTVLSGQKLVSQTVTQTFTFTGSTQTFVIPPCVGGMTISLTGAKGAQGGSSGGTGANGGSVRAILTATPGATLYIRVGGQGSVTTGGFNGGADGGASSATSGGGGGGASDIRLNGVALTDRIIVAAGGGGGGGSSTYNANGGAGGGGSSCSSPLGFGGGAATGFGTGNTAGGCAGGVAPNYASGGGGAGLNSGGAGGGAPSSATGGYGCAGVLGAGGAGGGTSFICGGATGGSNGGGGGGGGYYGGGGGMTGTGGGNGGGGGGSSWVNSTLFTSPSFTAGDGGGHGTVTITYDFMGTNAFVSASPSVICTGNAANLNAGGVSTYTWLPVGNFAGSNSPSVTVTPTTTTAFTVTGTNTINCVSSAVVVVTVSPAAPVLTLNANTTNTCQGTSIVLTASGALTHTWTGGVTNGVPFVPLATSGYTATGINGCGTVTASIVVTISPLPVTVSSSSSLVCAGSPVTLSAVSSGTSHIWQPFSIPGANIIVLPMSASGYTVTASNGVCSGTATLSLSTIPVPTIVASASSSNICVGDVVTLSATGGINYTWTPGNLSGNTVTVSPLAPISYSVTGDNSQACLAGATQVVVVNQLPTLTLLSSDPEICSGSTVSLSATGSSHTYTWSSGGNAGTEVVTPLSTTIYSVVGTDTITTCQNTGTIEVGVYIPTITVAGNTVICNGNSTNLTATGASNYTWSSGSQFASETLSPNITSTYTLNGITFTNNLSCPGSKTFQVLVNPNPTVTASSEKTEICKGETVSISASGAQTYLWSTNETTPTITATSTLITTLFYTVTGTNSQGCSTSTVAQVKVNSCISIMENNNQLQGFSVYPNPSKGEVTLTANEALEVRVINTVGQVINVITLDSKNNYTVDVSGLNKGLYYFLTQTKTGYTNSKVLVE